MLIVRANKLDEKGGDRKEFDIRKLILAEFSTMSFSNTITDYGFIYCLMTHISNAYHKSDNRRQPNKIEVIFHYEASAIESKR